MPCARPPTSTQNTLRNRYSVTLAFYKPVEFRCPQEGVERFFQPDHISRLTARTFCFGWSPSIRLGLCMAKCEFKRVWFAFHKCFLHRLLSLYPMAWLLCIHLCFSRGSMAGRTLENINSGSLHSGSSEIKTKNCKYLSMMEKIKTSRSHDIRCGRGLKSNVSVVWTVRAPESFGWIRQRFQQFSLSRIREVWVAVSYGSVVKDMVERKTVLKFLLEPSPLELWKRPQ